MDKTVARALWMDRVRGVAVLLVIAWHAVSIPVFFGLEMPGVVRWVNDALSPYRIPALLLLSGMLLGRSLAKPVGRYYWGKFANIVWPFLVWSVIYLLVNPGVDGTSIHYWLGGSYLWYLVVIGFCYCLGPLIRWIPPVVFVISFVALAVVFSSSSSTVLQVLTHAPYFFAGAALAPVATRLLHLSPWVIAPAIVLVLIWGAYSATVLGYASRIHPLGSIASLLGIICLMWLANRARRTPLLEWAGRHSLELYVAHFPMMVLVCRFGSFATPKLIVYAVLAVVGLGASALFASFLSRTPLFRLPTLKPAHAVVRFARR